MDILTVTELNSLIKQTIRNEDILHNCLIVGTITNLKKHSSGHYYFSLKDECATIEVSLFHAKSKPFARELENGLLVTLLGSVNFYEPWGKISVICQDMYIDKKSPLQIEFEKLKNELLALGYFSQEHKQPLPYMAKCIGIVTSSSGAVLHDILNVARNRNPLVQFKLFSVPVQGNGAGSVIAHGIKLADNDSDIDLIIVGRGGGSMEDLWCFNDRSIVEALYHCKKPTISAVGHETDYTLCDFAADVRSSTPSHAAELSVMPIAELLESLTAKETYLQNKLLGLISERKQDLFQLINNRFLFKAMKFFHGEEIKLKNIANKIDSLQKKTLDKEYSNLKRIQTKLISNYKEHIKIELYKLQLLEQKLHYLNPEKIHSLGYNRIFKNDKLVRDVNDLNINDIIEISFIKGNIKALIKEIEHG